MTARSFVYGRMVQDAQLTSLIGGSVNPRIFAKKSMTSSVEDTPYIVYKMGNSTAEGLSEHDDPERQYFQVWVHDYSDQETADYARIDEVVRAVKRAFQIDPASPGLWMVNFLETSQDLNDDTLNTVFRYLRFQIIKRRELIMPKSVIYVGNADRREVTRADLEKAGVKSFADSFKDLVFLKREPQEVNNDYADALVDSGLFVNFEHASGDEEPPAQQATDQSIQEAGGTPGAGDSISGTGTASSTTSGTTGSGTTAASTSRASR